MAGNPFDTLDSAHDYLRLLAEQVTDVQAEIAAEVGLAQEARAERSLDALRLVSYKLHQLEAHVTASRQLLNDLKMLRRVLVGDSEGAARRPDAQEAVQRKSPL